MFSGKLGVMEQKWGHSSSLTGTAATALTEADVNTESYAHRPSLHHHLAAAAMMSSAAAPVLCYSESGLPGSGGAELVGEGIKRKKKKKTH